MNAPVAEVVLGPVDESVRRAVGRALFVHAQFAQESNELTAASLLRQAAAVVALGGGVVSLAAVTRADLDAVVNSWTAPNPARTAVLAALVVELRPPQVPWAAALVAVWDKFMAAALAVPADAAPIPLDHDGGTS